MRYRKHSPETKMAVVMTLLAKDKTVSQISKEYGFSDSLIYRWRDEALNAMKAGFSEQKNQQKHGMHDAEKEQLLKLIGQQTVMLNFVKKISSEAYL